MEEINDVNRDKLAENVKVHISDTEARFEEEATFDDEEEEASHATPRSNPYKGDSDEEGSEKA